MKRIRMGLIIIIFLLTIPNISTSLSIPKIRKDISFSGEMYIYVPPNKMMNRIYVTKDKQRIEQSMEKYQSITTIIRNDKKLMWILNPQNKTYIEFRLDQNQQMPHEQQTPTSPESIEKIFKKALKIEKLSKEKVNDFWCTVYKVKIKDKDLNKEGIYTLWIADDISYLIKMKMEAGENKMIMEFKNLKIGPQPDHLFEIPAGYTKMEMPKMP